MVLRPATDADWPRAWEIQRTAFRDAVTLTSGGWTDEQVRKVADAWAADRTRMVEVDGAVVGLVRVERRADHDWLDLIALDPACQGRGLGTAMMRTLIDEARARGVPLRLSVYRTNPARRLYARLGFTEQPRDELRLLMVYDAGS